MGPFKEMSLTITSPNEYFLMLLKSINHNYLMTMHEICVHSNNQETYYEKNCMLTTYVFNFYILLRHTFIAMIFAYL